MVEKKNSEPISSSFSSTVTYARAVGLRSGGGHDCCCCCLLAVVVVGGGDGFSAGTTSTTARGVRRAEWSGARAATLRAFSPRAPVPPLFTATQHNTYTHIIFTHRTSARARVCVYASRLWAWHSGGGRGSGGKGAAAASPTPCSAVRSVDEGNVCFVSARALRGARERVNNVK